MGKEDAEWEKMDTVCKQNKCVGCYACKDLCQKDAITIQDTGSMLNAEIDRELCIQCNACHTVCQINHPIEKTKPLEWFQGWSKNEKVRKNSSSGGLGAELAKSMIEQGGIVCSCVFYDGYFGFKFAEKTADLKGFSGSKYVKSNLEGIYTKIHKLMNDGRSILFIGLPCQCAALKKSTKNMKSGELYLVDLICHGTPSAKLLDIFLEQYGWTLNSIKDISFRDKGSFAIRNKGQSIVTPGTMDCYSIAFLNSLIYTENCYECNYADSKRVSDLTIGDSWGSTLSEGEKGISLILCNTEKGKRMLDCANVFLTNVDIENAINSNPQLKAPSIMPKKRQMFFDGLSNGINFNTLVRKCCTKKWFRQFVKRQLINLRIIRGG